jgi:hypothetical protein
MNQAGFRLAAGAAVIALMAGACGSTGMKSSATKTATARASASATAVQPSTNGLEKMSATTVTHAAIGMLSQASSVRVQGTMIGGVPAETFDLRYEGTSVSGSYVDKNSTYEYIAVGKHSYLKTDAAGWTAMGNTRDVAEMMAGHWQRTGSAPSGNEWPSRAIFVGELGMREAAPDATVAQTVLDGHRVVVVTYDDGSKLYVANKGPAYPVRFDATGDGGGRRVFSQYGTQFHIAAPKNAQQ